MKGRCCTVVESDSMVQAPVNQPQSRLNIGVKALATSLEVLMTRTFCMLSDLHCPSYVLLTDRFIIRCTSEVRAPLRVSLWRFSWSMATLCVAAMDAPVLRRLLQPRHKRCWRRRPLTLSPTCIPLLSVFSMVTLACFTLFPCTLSSLSPYPWHSLLQFTGC